MAGILPNDFDASKLKFSNMRTLDNGGKVVYISYDGNPLILQTPEMVAPFGVSTWQDNVNKLTLDLSFKGKESRDNLNKFYQNMETLDNYVVSSAVENSPSWFKSKKSEVVLKELFTPIVRHAKDKNTGEITDKYPPTFKVSLPKKDGKYSFEVYGKDKKPIGLDDTEMKGAKVTALIQCLGVWIAGAKFGVSWKVLQMRVVPVQRLQGYSFADIEDDKVADEDLKDDDHADPEEVMESAVAKSDDGIVESEDELDVPPAPRKRVVAKKA